MCLRRRPQCSTGIRGVCSRRVTPPADPAGDGGLLAGVAPVRARQGQPPARLAVCAGCQPRFPRVCGGALPGASAQRGCAEYPGRQTGQTGASPVVTPAPGHRCCRCSVAGGGFPCAAPAPLCAARGAPVPSATGAVTLRPVMSGQRCSGFLRRAVHMCSGEEDRYHGSHPLLLLFPGLCLAARLLPPPPVLPAAGLMLPITKLPAEVGIQCFRRGPFTAGSAPESRRRYRGAGQCAPARLTQGCSCPRLYHSLQLPAGLELFRVEPLDQTQLRP